MNNVDRKEYGTVERVDSHADKSTRSHGRVAIGVLAVVCLGAFAIFRKGGTTAQPSVADFHKATKCTDQCSSYDYKGVAECEKHYQIQHDTGCDAKQYGCDGDDNGILRVIIPVATGANTTSSGGSARRSPAVTIATPSKRIRTMYVAATATTRGTSAETDNNLRVGRIKTEFTY